MRIAICDDIPDQLETIFKMVNEYIKANNINAETRTFLHPDTLLEYCKTENAQLYLLDVVMPMMSGVQLGLELRTLDREAQIIYTTSASEYALDSFSVNPLNYLIKPIQKDKLFSTLDLAMMKIKANEQTITIKTKHGLHTIPVSEVECCEYINHTVKYTLSGGKIAETTTIKGSFSEYIIPIISDKRFIQPHASFIVNMSCVERLSRDGFTLRSGMFVPVSGKLFSEVKNTYLNFRLGKEVAVIC
ncbi:MAG: DNA-binding response regulator [Clostridiales bacterium]|nr:MAG: DNA-binding response regulator [Clostridiales bacterium]